jgi:hypothetical protein
LLATGQLGNLLERAISSVTLLPVIAARIIDDPDSEMSLSASDLPSRKSQP